MSETTMRAMTYDGYGDTSVLRLTDRPLPKVGPGEVLVRVRSAAVNPVDWKLMAGGLDALMDTIFPAIPAGTWRASSSRWASTPRSSRSVTRSSPMRARTYVHGGTFADYVSLPVRTVAPKPRVLSWDEAAGLPLAGLTAYQVLTRLGLSAGETVLVHGAAGGVGSLGVQIARSLGARVIGTASERNHEALRALGAEPVEYGDGLAERVRALAPEGVDLVADFVGGVVDVTTAVLRPGGRHASIADPGVLAVGGQWMWVRPDRDDLTALSELADRGELEVRVAQTFELADVAGAFRLSQEGHTAGKIAIRVSTDAD